MQKKLLKRLCFSCLFVAGFAASTPAFSEDQQMSVETNCVENFWLSPVEIDGNDVNLNWYEGQDGGSIYGKIDKSGNVHLTGTGRYIFIIMTGKLSANGGSGDFKVGGNLSCEGTWTSERKS